MRSNGWSNVASHRVLTARAEVILKGVRYADDFSDAAAGTVAEFIAFVFQEEWWDVACRKKRAMLGGTTLLAKPHTALGSLSSVALSSVWVKALRVYRVDSMSVNAHGHGSCLTANTQLQARHNRLCSAASQSKPGLTLLVLIMLAQLFNNVLQCRCAFAGGLVHGRTLQVFRRPAN